VLAYHLLCRRPPFAGPDLSLLQMHLRAEPPPPSMAWPDVPPELDRLLVRMLAKRADDRPTLDEIEDTLRAMLGVVERPMQFADGSHANLVLPIEEPWYLRWLMSRKGDVSGDVLGRPILPAPPFKATWMALAVSLAALAGLLNALP
jgi:serine/threonine protein kinase